MSRLERTLNIVLVVAAVALASSVVYGQFAGRSSRAKGTPFGPPTYVETWRELLPSGSEMGDSNGTVKVVEFGDFECPYCRQFDSTLRNIQQAHPGLISHTYIHFPLSMHRFARPAARAAECAKEQGHFSDYARLLFRKQDSLGLKAWTSYAVDAGVRDTARFAACNAKTAPVERIETGVAVGSKLGVHGTPTVIVNGWQFTITPTDSLLMATIRAIQSGKKPDT